MKTCIFNNVFSSLRRLKTYLRNTITKNKISGQPYYKYSMRRTLISKEVIEQVIKTKIED